MVGEKNENINVGFFFKKSYIIRYTKYTWMKHTHITSKNKKQQVTLSWTSQKKQQYMNFIYEVSDDQTPVTRCCVTHSIHYLVDNIYYIRFGIQCTSSSCTCLMNAHFICNAIITYLCNLFFHTDTILKLVLKYYLTLDACTMESLVLYDPM